MDVLTWIVLVNNSLAADRLAEGCEISRFSVAVLTWMFFLLFRTGWSFSVVVSKNQDGSNCVSATKTNRTQSHCSD